MSFRTIAIALFIGGLVWLTAIVGFVLHGLHTGQLPGPGPAILGAGFFGLVPALFFWTVGAVFLRQYRLEAAKQRD